MRHQKGAGYEVGTDGSSVVVDCQLLWRNMGSSNMEKRGELTANRFVLLQVACWNLFIIIACLAFPISYEVTIILIVLTILCWILGYPMTRRIYRKFFPDK